MDYFQIALFLAAFLCSLVAGFLFAFAVVVMPGLGKLGDGEFLRAFKAMDRVIQDNQPVFIAVWLGSILSLVVAAAIGVGQLAGWDRWILILATAAYLLGVQFLTFAKNIPLNNSLQALNLDALDNAAMRSARDSFESRWNRWNIIRAIVSGLVTALLLTLLIRY